jgi:hypothetical protein
LRAEELLSLSFILSLQFMRVKDLLELYQNTPRLFQLADRLSFAQPQKIYLKNLQEAHRSLRWQQHFSIRPVPNLTILLF